MGEEKKIWEWLLERIGNEYGTAGLMGNLVAESGLRPDNLNNEYEKLLGMTDEEYTEAVDSGEYPDSLFVNDHAAYGLAQWCHPDRKRALYQFVKERGASIGDLDTQLEFLWKELGKYLEVISTLVGAYTVREASDAVMLKYEIPGDTSEEAREMRAAYGCAILWKYAGEEWEAEWEGAATEEIKQNDKAEKITELAREKVGCKYLFGAKGETVNGEQVFDCRGFTWWLLKQVGITISSVGATTQWNTAGDWEERGKAEDMPDVVCCVFKHRESDGKMAHTGMHLGGGIILHCTENGGVKYGSMTDKTWTHYAIPKGLYTRDEIGEARERKGERSLKNGDTGEEVKALQETLNRLGYKCGDADGIFGAKTQTAVKAFQSANGLKADGIVGPITREELKKAEHGEAIKDGSEEEETPVLRSYIKFPLDKAMDTFMVLADLLGYTVDTRSGNVSPIDWQ